MPQDVIGNDGGHRRWSVTVVAVLVVAAGLVLVLRFSHSRRAVTLPTPTAPPSASNSASPVVTASRFPDVVVMIGTQLAAASPGGVLQPLADLPAGAKDVWATTLPSLSVASSAATPANPHIVHVFGIAGGRAFRDDVAAGRVDHADLGTADAILQTQEYPVLVHDGSPVAVGSPGGRRVDLPGGWRPGRFESLGYAGILLRPTATPGAVEIASWAPGGTPQPLTMAGLLLGVTDGGQAIWLDPTCSSAPRCALYFGDIGGLHPTSAGLPAPPGTRYVVAPAVYGGGSYLAAVAEHIGSPAASTTPVLVLVEPWEATTSVVPGSDGVVSAAGVFWSDATHVVFTTPTPGGLRLNLYDVDTRHTEQFGPVLPVRTRLLTAYGSTGGVTVRP